MELEVTWGRLVRIWWAYVWRNLITLVVVLIGGMVLGGIIGFIMGLAGADKSTIRLVTMPLGAIIGLAASFVPLKLILGKDFGEFRLLLVPKQP